MQFALIFLRFRDHTKKYKTFIPENMIKIIQQNTLKQDTIIGQTSYRHHINIHYLENQ